MHSERESAAAEAIANADAHLNNAGLPTYSEMVAALRRIDRINGINGSTGGSKAMVSEFKLIARSLLARVDDQIAEAA